MKKIVVLGGAGAQGLFAVEELIRKGKFDEIIIASRNIDNVQKVVDQLNSPMVSAAQVDVMDKEALMELIKDVDVVANSTGPYYLLAEYVIDACIDAGVHYVDICDDIVVFDDMFNDEIQRRAKENDVTILMGLGISPGIFPLHALYQANKLDEVHDVSFYVSGSNLGILSGEAVLTHMLQNMLGDLQTIKDGKIHLEKPFEGLEDYHFDGVGTIPVSTLGHPEIFTLRQALPQIRNMIVKIGYVEKEWYLNFVEQLKAGFGSEEPLMVKGQEVVPLDFLVAKLLDDVKNVDLSKAYSNSVSTITVSGIKDGNEVESKSTYVTGSSATIGYPLAMAADMIATGEISQRGIMVPEQCIDPKPFLDDFAVRMKETGHHLEIKEEYNVKEYYIKAED